MLSNEEFNKLMEENPVEALRLQREDFITKRTQQESKVYEWKKKVQGLDPAVLNSMGIVLDKCSLKDLVPEYYVDLPSQDKIKVQLEAANAMFNRLNELGKSYIEEARKCCVELQGLDSNTL